MVAADSIIVLDDEDEDEAAAQMGPSQLPSNPVSLEPEASGPSESHRNGGSHNSGGRKCYKLENERLFEEFLELCKVQTSDHPEVVPFLHKQQQRTQSLFLASAEFCNIMPRVLSRARNRPAKLYVYINELCTVLKAHSSKKKQNLAPAPSTPSEPSGGNPPTESSSDLTNAENTASEASRTCGSRRQIQRLEQLLALYEGDDGEEDEEGGGDNEGDKGPTRGNSQGEQQNKGLSETAASPGASPDPYSIDAESSREQPQEPFLEEGSPLSQSFQLEIEALHEDTTRCPEERDISSSRKQKIPSPLSWKMWSPLCPSMGVSLLTLGKIPVPCARDLGRKRSQEKKPLGSGPLENSYVERQKARQGNGKNVWTPPTGSPPWPIPPQGWTLPAMAW
ncbi:Death domain-associated protein 6 [Cricetulus griseus]|uniref:Death domain-associated protein 6 n=1 Tax=Cricetulus griseus TaxID=10029 RepID=G3HQ34_CRIGR|nr:Death domain-associated protein 6 [Cricetulus griseus]